MTYHDPAAADHRKSELSPSDGAAPGGPASTAKAPLWIWALGASLIAGLIGGMCGESTYHLVKPLINRSANPTPSGVVRSPTGEWVRRTNLPENFASLGAYDKSAAIADATTEGNIGAERLNSAIAYGVLGAVLAGGLGLAGGFARRSISGGLVAAVVGLVVGGVVGAGMSVALTPLFYKLLQPEVNPLAAPFVSHSLLFAAIGVAGGLALGIGRGRRGWIVRTTLGAATRPPRYPGPTTCPGPRLRLPPR